METAQIIVVPGKAPFHYGLFFCAVNQRIGEPTTKTNIGDAGYYDHYWEMTPRLWKIVQNESLIATIGEWMKCFDLQWPESRCDIAKWPHSPDEKKTYLRITISHKRIKT